MKSLVLIIAPVVAIALMLTGMSRVSSPAATGLTGVVQTGGTSSSQPLPNVDVSLFEATAGQPTMLGQATTDGSGRFSIRYTKATHRASSLFKQTLAKEWSSSLSSARACRLQSRLTN